MPLCYVAYASRALAQGREAVALANGVFLMNLRRPSGVWWEPSIRAALAR